MMFGLPVAARVMSGVMVLLFVSAMSAMLLLGPRVYAAMATDRALPTFLAHHNQRGVPVRAVLTQGVLATVFVLIGDLGSLIEFVGFTLAIFAALTVGAVFILRARGHRAAYRTFWYPLTPILFIGLSVWVVYKRIDSAPKQSFIVGVLLGVGALLYVLMTRGKPPIPDESLPELAAQPAAPPQPLPTARALDSDEH